MPQEITPDTDNYREKKYTDEELLTVLRDLGCDIGRAPTVAELRNLGEVAPDVSTYARRFGAYTDALRAAGLESPHGMSDETLLRMLIAFYERTGSYPRKRDMGRKNQLPSATTYANRFGSFAGAIVLAQECSMVTVHKDTV